MTDIFGDPEYIPGPGSMTDASCRFQSAFSMNSELDLHSRGQQTFEELITQRFSATDHQLSSLRLHVRMDH
jgi:hypothetical protein